MPFQRFFHILRLAVKSIAVHRLRSTLTILGIVLGVAAVIVTVGLGEAKRSEALDNIKDLGATNIIVRSQKPLDEKKDRQGEDLLKYGITYKDLERIESTVPTVLSVTPIRVFRKEVRCLDRKFEARVVGTMPNYMELNGLTLAHGRFILPRDNDQFANVCVLGAEAAEKLFPIEDPLGHTIAIVGGHNYRVIGVTAQKAPTAGIGGSLDSQDFNRDVYIPFQTDRVRFGETLFEQRAGAYQVEKLQISQLTIAVDSVEHVRQTADVVQGLLDQFHTKKDFSVTVPLDLLEKVEQTQKLFTWLIASIAIVSVVVGGIGIMNIMLATVTERTREIGIRRALGAKRKDITVQFLVEAMTLSSAGGLLGLGLGLAGVFGVPAFLGFMHRWGYWSSVNLPLQLSVPWILRSLVVTVVVGVIFGIYPARRAALMDPIEALRHE